MQYVDDVASSGYYVHIDEIPGPNAVPAIVPTGMDAIIVLAPPKKLFELSGCIPIGKTQKLQYFKNYDSDGRLCLVDLGLKFFQAQFQCTTPILDYFPPNGSDCNTRLLLFSFVAVAGTSVDVTQLAKIKSNDDTLVS